MIRHLLKLVWNRKRSNLLVAVEILLSFIVLTAVLTLVVFYLDNYRRPLGFDVDRIWTITVQMNEGGGPGSVTVHSDGTDKATPADDGRVRKRAQLALVSQLLMTLRDMPEVETAAGAAIVPYSGSTWSSDIQMDGRHYRYGGSAGTDDLAGALGIRVTRGRWFSSEDDGAAWQPVVINKRFATEMFAGKDPIGRFLTEERPGEQASSRMRVVGVIQDFRKDGEYAPAQNFLFSRLSFAGTAEPSDPPRELVIRVRPGTPATFEERAMARLRAAAPEWTFQAAPLTTSRETALRFWLAPLSAAAVVSAFLLLMVGMGLTGVLWLHVTQRTREIGLRRAKGATIVRIRRQLVGEVFLLTALAAAVGVLIVIQFPLLQVFDVVSPMVYAVSITASLALVFLLTGACAWGPGRVATAIEPADALRYE
jgi:putative ABC transport system permease protein